MDMDDLQDFVRRGLAAQAAVDELVGPQPDPTSPADVVEVDTNVTERG